MSAIIARGQCRAQTSDQQYGGAAVRRPRLLSGTSSRQGVPSTIAHGKVAHQPMWDQAPATAHVQGVECPTERPCGQAEGGPPPPRAPTPLPEGGSADESSHSCSRPGRGEGPGLAQWPVRALGQTPHPMLSGWSSTTSRIRRCRSNTAGDFHRLDIAAPPGAAEPKPGGIPATAMLTALGGGEVSLDDARGASHHASQPGLVLPWRQPPTQWSMGRNVTESLM